MWDAAKKMILVHLRQPRTAVVLFLAVCLLSRLYPVWRSGDAAFGYDTGIYRHFIQGYYERLGDSTITPFAFSGYSNLLRILGQDVDSIMFGSYVLIGFLCGVALYAIVRREYGERHALCSLVLFAGSITQYEFYWWYYYRNFLALFFFLIAMLFWQRRSWLMTIPLIAIGSLHPITLVPILLTLFLFSLGQPRERTFLWRSIGVVVCGVAALNWAELRQYLHIVIDQGVLLSKNSGNAEWSGQFIGAAFYARAAVLYLPLALIGTILGARKYLWWILFLVVSAALIAAGVLFSRRLFVFVDLAAIVLGGSFLSDLWTMIVSRRGARLAAGVYFCLLAVSLGAYVIRKSPLLPPVEIVRIEEADRAVPAGAPLLVVSSATAPWVYGYTHHPVIAPGMFEFNRWNRDEWVQFWSASDNAVRHALLNRYNISPLYTYLTDADRIRAPSIASDPHFIHRSEHLWAYYP